MWDYVQSLQDKAGVVAALAFLGFVACGVVLRALWKANQGLHDKVERIQKEEHQKRSDMREAHVLEVQNMERQMTAMAQKHATYIHELQEKRVARAEMTTEKVITTVTRIERAMEKQSSALDVLIEVGRRP